MVLVEHLMLNCRYFYSNQTSGERGTCSPAAPNATTTDTTTDTATDTTTATTTDTATDTATDTDTTTATTTVNTLRRQSGFQSSTFSSP